MLEIQKFLLKGFSEYSLCPTMRRENPQSKNSCLLLVAYHRPRVSYYNFSGVLPKVPTFTLLIEFSECLNVVFY